MNGNLSGIFGNYYVSLFVIWIIVSLVELSFSITWNKTYFTSGLMIFVKRIPVNNCHTNVPKLDLFEEAFHSGVISSLSFKEIDAFSYGFREEIFEIKWIRTGGFMHGLLIFDTKNNQVIVKGFASWSVLVFSFILLSGIIFFIAQILLDEGLAISALRSLGNIGYSILFTVLFIWIIHLFQSSRFINVASFAAQSWERKHLRNIGEA
jgi:hypothetical protein